MSYILYFLLELFLEEDSVFIYNLYINIYGYEWYDMQSTPTWRCIIRFGILLADWPKVCTY